MENLILHYSISLICVILLGIYLHLKKKFKLKYLWFLIPIFLIYPISYLVGTFLLYYYWEYFEEKREH